MEDGTGSDRDWEDLASVSSRPSLKLPKGGHNVAITRLTNRLGRLCKPSALSAHDTQIVRREMAFFVFLRSYHVLPIAHRVLVEEVPRHQCIPQARLTLCP